MKNMIILGSEGYLGKEAQEFFSDKYNIIRLDMVSLKPENNKNYFQVDLTNDHEVDKVISYLEDKKIYVDAIVNLMGLNLLSSFYTISKDNWEKTFTTNVTSFLFFLKRVYQCLSSKVSIVVVASQNGVVAHESRIDYGPSKAALIHLVKNLTIDFIEDNERDIKINSISPSYISNKSNHQFFNSIEGKKLVKRIPYKKILDVDDVIYAIEFLTSDKSKAIRGQNLIIDYGYTII